MKLSLGQQIALSLRQRPLLLPMLLAAVAINAVVLNQVRQAPAADTGMTFFLAQAALLAFWTNSTRWWWLKAIVSLLVLTLFASARAPDFMALALANYAFFYVLVLGCEVALQLIKRARQPNRPPPQFGVAHLLLAMTVVGAIISGSRATLPRLFPGEGEWSAREKFNVAMVLVAAVSVPLLSRRIAAGAKRRFHSSALAVIYALMASGLIGYAATLATDMPDGDRLINEFINTAFVVALWRVVTDARPNAASRRTGRQRRREQRLEKHPTDYSAPPPGAIAGRVDLDA